MNNDNERKRYKACWIEDDITWTKTYMELLEDEDIVVEIYDNAPDAIDAITQGVYHLILVDHELKGSTGLDVVKSILSVGERPKRPIILISGRIKSLPEPETVVSEYLAYGVLEYREKTTLNVGFGKEMRNHIEQFFPDEK